IVLAYQRILRPCVARARRSAVGGPGHIDARGACRHGEGLIGAGGAELAGPELGAAGVVLAHERIGKPGTGLARQGAGGAPGHVYARTDHGDPKGFIRVAGAELAGPEDLSVRVVPSPQTIPPARPGFAPPPSPRRPPALN